MAYTNSPLVSYTKLSPNHSGQRTHSIDRITPHCVVGQCSVETLGNIFLPTSRQASSNYGIGVDGRVGMYVEEKNRSWCSSSAANDQRAITIECASDNTEPYAFKDVVYKRLIELCADICKRNGKTKLLWLGDKTKTLNYTPKSDEMVLTVHRWFANKSCPGNWMYARMGDLASKVTAALGSEVKPIEPTQPTGTIKAGDLVTITGSTYYGGKSIPGWVKKLRWYVVEVSGDRAVINKDESGRYAIMSPVKTSALAVAGTKPAEDYRIHTVVHGRKICKQSPTLDEGNIHDAVISAMNELFRMQAAKDAVKAGIAAVLAGEEQTMSLPAVEFQIRNLQERQLELFQLIVSAGADCTDYDEELQQVNMAKTRLMAQKAELEKEQRGAAAFESRLAELDMALEQASGTLTDFDELTVRQLVSNIKVLDKDSLLICFKDGTEITQAMQRRQTA